MPTTILVQQPGDEAIEAVAAYAQSQAGWRLAVFSDRSLSADPGILAGAAGVIASTRSAATARRLQASGLPWINIRHTAPGAAALVLSDAREIGRCAGEHLAGLGVEVAGYGPLGAEVLAGLGQVCGGRVPTVIPPRQAVAWLRHREGPVAVLAASDGMAATLIQEALDAGLRVPEDLAVCGINDNRAQVLCAAVPLTSVAHDVAGMAAVAARLLHAHLTKRRSIPRITRLPPRGLVVRRSTDLGHGDQPLLAKALGLMRAGAAEGLHLDAVFRACACSRSTLERIFRNRLGTSPGAWLRELRLRAARRALAEGGRSCADIAVACGFSSGSHLAQAFTQRFGVPPSQWRPDLADGVDRRSRRRR